MMILITAILVSQGLRYVSILSTRIPVMIPQIQISDSLRFFCSNIFFERMFKVLLEKTVVQPG